MNAWEAKEPRAPQRATLVRNVLAFRDQLDPWLLFSMSKLMSALRVGVCDELRWQCENRDLPFRQGQWLSGRAPGCRPGERGLESRLPCHDKVRWTRC